MSKAGFVWRGLAAAVSVLVVGLFLCTPAALAQEGAAEGAAAEAAVAAQRGVLTYFGAALGLGLIVFGAAFGIGKFAAAAAEGIARQPAAATQISGAVTLPLFLLEGVAIIAEVVVLLIVLLK